MSNQLDYIKVLTQKKKSVKILILGSYTRLNSKDEEEPCIEELEAVKEHLKKKGFKNAKLVNDWIIEKDIPPESYDAYFRGKSFHYIEKWADILVFIFLKDTDNFTVIRELSHTVEIVSDKCRRSIILRPYNMNLHSAIRGDILVKRIFEDSYKNEKELNDTAFSACFNILFSF